MIVENLEVRGVDFFIGEVKFDVVDIVLLEFGCTFARGSFLRQSVFFAVFYIIYIDGNCGVLDRSYSGIECKMSSCGKFFVVAIYGDGVIIGLSINGGDV